VSRVTAEYSSFHAADHPRAFRQIQYIESIMLIPVLDQAHCLHGAHTARVRPNTIKTSIKNT